MLRTQQACYDLCVTKRRSPLRNALRCHGKLLGNALTYGQTEVIILRYFGGLLS
jgi:hypothetical protein